MCVFFYSDIFYDTLVSNAANKVTQSREKETYFEKGAITPFLDYNFEMHFMVI